MFKFVAALLPFLLVLVASPAWAQEETDWLDIEVGKSVVLEAPANMTTIAITNTDIADYQLMAGSKRLHVQGLKVGSTDLVVEVGAGRPPIIYEVTVHQDLSDLIRRIDGIVDGEPPRVYPMRERIVVEGPVPDLDTLERISLVTSIFDEEFINLMTVQGDHQVQLEVIFAEVSRTSLRELGMNILYGDSTLAGTLLGPGTTDGVRVDSAPLDGGVVNAGSISQAALSTFHVAAWVDAINLGAILSIMDDYKLSKILAQPTIVSLSGQQGEFLAGGEVPIPAPSGTGNISIDYKEYGIKLVFVPTVLAGNLIDMRVQIEVSELDYASGTRITGIEVPGFISRKGKSHLRVDSGMTFAMAGLLTDNTTYTRAEIPGLGRIPLIGALFRYTRHHREESELLILVTPRLVRPLGPGEVPAPPGLTENNNPSDIELFLLGMDHRPGSRSAKPTGDVGLAR